MLSILIPVHNFNCVKLVSDLHQQCYATAKAFEILVLDDASTICKEENRLINKLSNCSYLESSIAYGRGRARNELGEKAAFSHLLFIDADAIVDNPNFIQNYLDHLPLAEVLVGGLKYSLMPPKEERLRWFYGTQREVKTAAIRNQTPYRSLLSFNFLIKRSVFLENKFIEESTYGHEDTLLGLSFKLKSISVLHINNPLVHDSHETNMQFIEKSLTAVAKYVNNPSFRQAELVAEIKIFRVFERFKAWQLVGFLSFIYSNFGAQLKKNLLSNKPSLDLFDLYRLSYLANTYKEFKAYKAKLPNQ